MVVVGGGDEEEFEFLGFLPETEGDFAVDREVRSFTPEQRLLAGVLRSAVSDYREGCGDAEEWIFGVPQRTVWTFGFGMVCASLHLDEEYVRELVRGLPRAHRVYGGDGEKIGERRAR